MACVNLLDAIRPPAANVHRMAGEENPEHAAIAYEAMLRRFFEVAAGGPPPSFDLILLGMGANGHTASLFPNTPPLFEKERWVMANHVDDPTPWRLTMTPPIINAAAHVFFLVSGVSKADRVKQVLQGALDCATLPAQAIQPAYGELLWMVDADAASRLGGEA